MESKKINTLLIGISYDTSGNIYMLVGRRIDGGQTMPVKLIHGEAVKLLYKELTDEELVMEDFEND